MKKTILCLTVIIFIAGTVFTGCQSSARRVENAENKLDDARDKVVQAKQDLNEARQDSFTDYQQFRIDSENKIRAHEKSIADFKARIAKEKKENRDLYEKKLTVLEQKNTDLKKKLDEYKADGKENWVAFKTEFTKDMDALGKALKDFVDYGSAS
jgi:chromosome segregation ATPase